MTKLRNLGLFVLALSLLAMPVGAVQNALVTGSVYDASGAPVAGATVRLINAAIGFSQSVQTDASGNFSFPSVPPAENYLMSVEASGFATAIRPGIALAVGEARLVVPPFEMERGETTPTPEAPTEPAKPEVHLDLVSATLSGVIDGRNLRTLPLANRDFLDLALLIPGTYPVEQGSNLEGASLVVNGARADMNNFLLDGVDNNDYTVNQSLPFQLVEALQEFRVQTSNSQSEFSRAGGAQINSLTRSGTNDLHGTLFLFHRNDALSANQSISTHRGGSFDAFAESGELEALTRNIAENFFGAPGFEFFPTPVLSDPLLARIFDDGRTPKLIQNQFGANLGGPLHKDKLFFFFNYEGFRVDNDRPVFERVPNQFFRNLALCCPNNASTRRVNSIFNLYPVPNVPTSTVLDGFGNPVSDPMFGGFSSFDPTGAFVTGESPNSTNSDNALARIDWRLNDQVDFSFKYNIQDVRQVQGGALFPTSRYPGSGVDVDGRNQSFSFNYLHRLSDRTHNEFRFGLHRFRLDVLPQDAALDPAPIFSNLNFQDRGLPTILLGGVFTFGGNARLGAPLDAPTDRSNNLWQFSDNVVMLRGRHTVKFGGEVRHSLLNVRNEALGRGVLTMFSHSFAAVTGLPDLASIASVDSEFHQGIRSSADFIPGGGFDRTFTANSWNWFIQDTWRPRSNVSVTFGLRWEANVAPKEDRNRLVNNYPGACPQFLCLIQSGTSQILSPFLGPLGTPVLGVVGDDFVSVGTASFRAPRAGYDTDWNNFAPQIGLAWDPWGNGRTVFRGGYGFYYDQESFQPLVNMLHNPPFVQQIHSNFALPFFFFTLGDTYAPAVGIYRNFGGAGQGAFNADGVGVPSTWFRGPYSITTIDPDRRTPYVQQWNASWQVQLWGSSVFEAGYVGAVGHKLARNRLVFGCNSAAFAVNDGLNCVNSFIGATFAPGATAQQTLTIVNQENSANSNFHSLQFRFDTNWKGLTLNAFYQWAKSIDNASSLTGPTILFPFGAGPFLCENFLINCDQFSAVNTLSNPALNLRPGLPLVTTRPLFPQDSGNLRGERGVSDFDIRQRFILRYIYDFPKWEAVGAVAGSGWQIAGITTLQTGQPYTVYTDFFGLPLRPSLTGNPGNNNGNPDGVINSGLPVGCNVYFTCSNTGGVSSFDPTLNSILQPGSQGRNMFTGDRLVNFDFSILKNTYLGEGERFNVQFRAEFFNIFNTSNYRLPYSRAGQYFDASFDPTFFPVAFPDPFFGQSLQARSPREVQFGVKFIF